jgi:hypothetical protein
MMSLKHRLDIHAQAITLVLALPLRSAIPGDRLGYPKAQQTADGK